MLNSIHILIASVSDVSRSVINLWPWDLALHSTHCLHSFPDQYFTGGFSIEHVFSGVKRAQGMAIAGSTMAST